MKPAAAPKKRPKSEVRNGVAVERREFDNSNSVTGPFADMEKEKKKMIVIFQEESAKNEDWSSKYIPNTMYLLGYGAYGSVFQVTTRLYPNTKTRTAKERYVYHPDFLARYATQRKLKVDQHDRLKDKYRHDRLFDTVAIKYEIIEQSQLEDGITRFHLFLRREFLVLDTLWRKFPRLLVGFPVVFDFGYIGDRLQYSVNPKYKNIFTYLNIEGEEVKFFADTNNRNLQGVTKISYLTMELLGPSIEDYRSYFSPWYTASKLKTFFEVRTVFRIADQLLCRLYLLHRAGFVHHDIKPDNLAVGYGRALNTIYLIDFGFAKQISDSPVIEWMGSRKFIAVDTYDKKRPNYSQDVESWFYLVVVLLYDCLPWSDDVIVPMLDTGAEEGAKWALASAIKKTWWGENSSALTLHATMNSIQILHQKEVPDIRQIIEQLHKKVRDLRGHLCQMTDAKTLTGELSNSQSLAARGYMSIRKVLLQIFALPNIAKNPLLGDIEMRNYLETRQAQGLPQFKWDPINFEWEWDKSHERMINQKDGSPSTDLSDLYTMQDAVTDQENFDNRHFADLEPTDSHNIIASASRQQLLRLAAELPENYGARCLRTRALDAEQFRAQHMLYQTNQTTKLGNEATTQRQQEFSRREQPDEISYVYDSGTNTLVPKLRGDRGGGKWRRRPRHLSAAAGGPQQSDTETQNAKGQEVTGDDEDELWRLTNPSFLTLK